MIDTNSIVVDKSVLPEWLDASNPQVLTGTLQYVGQAATNQFITLQADGEEANAKGVTPARGIVLNRSASAAFMGHYEEDFVRGQRLSVLISSESTLAADLANDHGFRDKPSLFGVDFHFRKRNR